MIDIKKAIDNVKAKTPETATETQTDGEGEADTGDHKAKIEAAMSKVEQGLAELKDCLNEY